MVDGFEDQAHIDRDSALALLVYDEGVDIEFGDFRKIKDKLTYAQQCVY